MMYEQYVVRPTNTERDVLKIDKQDFLTGYGIVRAIPGPVFSIGTYTGGMALRETHSTMMQLLGCFLGAIGIFLPSALLVLFFFPVWHNLKKYVVIYRALEGINAVVVGIMVGSFFYLLIDILKANNIENLNNMWFDVGLICITFCCLNFTKVPAPIIVVGCLLLGFVVP